MISKITKKKSTVFGNSKIKGTHKNHIESDSSRLVRIVYPMSETEVTSPFNEFLS